MYVILTVGKQEGFHAYNSCITETARQKHINNQKDLNLNQNVKREPIPAVNTEPPGQRSDDLILRTHRRNQFNATKQHWPDTNTNEEHIQKFPILHEV